MKAHPARRQQGLVTLVTVLILLFAAAMLSAYAQRHEVTERRMAQLDAEWVQAQAAAQSAITAAQALLNRESYWPGCTPPGQSAREHWLRADSQAGWQLRAPGVTALRCALDAQGGWQCPCPNQPEGSTHWDDARSTASVALEPTTNGLIVRAQGCTRALGDCGLGSTGPAAGAWAQSTSRQRLQWLGALARLPAAAITVQGTLSWQATTRLQADPGMSQLVETGRLARGPLTALVPPPGTPPASLLALSPAWTERSAPHFLAPWLGQALSAFDQRMGLTPLRCASDCSAALQARARNGERLLWVEGPLNLTEPLVLGSADRPVLVIATGSVAITAPLQLQGLLVAAQGGRWSAGAGQLSGGLLSAGDWAFEGPIQVLAAPQVLARLPRELGRFVRPVGGQEAA